MNIRVRNPHSVLAALETRPDDVVEICASQAPQESDAWKKVVRLAKELRISVTGPKAQSKNARDFKEDGRQGGNDAAIKEREGISVEELFRDAPKRANGSGLWLALDCLQDPHNVGAIFRAAAFFGVQGILLTQERSAPISQTVYDVASGGVEYVPFTLQTNLQRGFEVAKEAGLWILGATEHEGDELDKIKPDRPWLLVLGNEEKGMRRLTTESCDLLCKIPSQGKVTSLNVSVAAGILISHFSGKS
ncbi:MAG: 23S rRNA (guanosine(2251)-2'-O)-methyltransferase RlmB [Bdellovibrionota bacterium]